MRLIVILIVVILHLAALAWILGSRGRAESEDGGGVGADSALEKPMDGAEAGEPAERVAESGGTPPYSDTAFRNAPQALPSGLASDARICRAGIVVDWTDRVCYWEKHADRSLAIASLTKMMTVLLLMEDLDRHDDLSLQTMVPVTASAARVGGRQVWLDPRESFTIDDLLQCILIRSANDCAYLLGEFLAEGNHAAFVARMNRRARQLGMDSMTFHNSHGLPVSGSRKENVGNVRHLAYLAGLLLSHDTVVKWSSTRLSYIREDTKPFQLVNTNKLITSCPGVNGMKTGYTDESGYCLAATCERNGREMVVVALGCPSGKRRDALVASLMEWAYTLH